MTPASMTNPIMRNRTIEPSLIFTVSSSVTQLSLSLQKRLQKRNRKKGQKSEVSENKKNGKNRKKERSCKAVEIKRKKIQFRKKDDRVRKWRRGVYVCSISMKKRESRELFRYIIPFLTLR